MEALDILWIAITLSILTISALLSWTIYHVAMVIKRVHTVLDEANTVLGKIESAISGVKEKLDHHAKILDPLVALAGSIVKEVREKKLKK